MIGRAVAARTRHVELAPLEAGATREYGIDIGWLRELREWGLGPSIQVSARSSGQSVASGRANHPIRDLQVTGATVLCSPTSRSWRFSAWGWMAATGGVDDRA